MCFESLDIIGEYDIYSNELSLSSILRRMKKWTEFLKRKERLRQATWIEANEGCKKTVSLEGEGIIHID